jgi:SAM-dependent methyltransferase
MHPTAMLNARMFFDVYGASFASAQVADIGAQDVNGSLRDVCPSRFTYIGVDFVAGKGVDVILEDPYRLPFEDQSIDMVVSSSCFEHSELFWVLFLEIVRVLKQPGLLYLNAPSNGEVHRYPLDCWRFYPDSGKALTTWARRSGYDVTLLESYTSKQIGDVWNDFVAVFLKGDRFSHDFPGRITDGFEGFTNGTALGRANNLNPQRYPEDMDKLMLISDLISNRISVKR